MNNNLKQLIDLVNAYIDKQCSTNEFCEQFTEIYNHHLIPNDQLSDDMLFFKKICYLCERYSPYEEDVLLPGKFFIDEKTFQCELLLILSEYNAINLEWKHQKIK